MTVGLRIRDGATGAVTLEITDRLTRIIGTINTFGSNGSISVPEFQYGTGWAVPRVIELDFSQPSPCPIISISTSGMSWSYPSGASGNACDITYGVY